MGAVYQARGLAGDYLLPRAAWAPHALQPIDSTVFVELAEGVDLRAGKAAVARVAEVQGAPAPQDRQEYVDAASEGANQLLGLVYVMLALAIVLALLGIGNTLSLSLHERTRELGLLRAVGQTRGQLRSMVRWESVILALLGTVSGLGLGVLFGWALVRSASTPAAGAFSLPPTQLLAVLAAGAAAGVLAALRPAHRAAKRHVLDAIATE